MVKGADMVDEVKKRIQEELLKEVKNDKMEWWFLGMVDGGCFIKARGPTEAWRLLHGLGFWIRGGTNSVGPIDQSTIDKMVPESNRWRKLTVEEVALAFPDKTEEKPSGQR
jgi:hypothetical protein